MAPELLDGNSCRVSEKVRNFTVFSILFTLILTKHCLGKCDIECLSFFVSCRLMFSHLALQCGKS